MLRSFVSHPDDCRGYPAEKKPADGKTGRKREEEPSPGRTERKNGGGCEPKVLQDQDTALYRKSGPSSAPPRSNVPQSSNRGTNDTQNRRPVCVSFSVRFSLFRLLGLLRLER